jgi:NAD+ diphosphatase
MMAPGFTGSPLDRVDHIRSDADAVTALLNDWRGRVLGLDGLDPRLSAEGRLVWQSMAEVSLEVELILLGLHEDKPHFAPITSGQGGAHRSPAIWRALASLPAEEAAIYGTARSLIDWHNGHRFCGQCGGETKVFRAGWGRVCGGCGKEHFPRTDPVVIMLAIHGDRCLLGRQARFAPGMYSALAGFLEPGETIEEAVRREVMEEAGVRIGRVTYMASQPWPFPATLMIGCIGEALTEEVIVDYAELEDARWFTRAEVQEMLGGGQESGIANGLGAPQPIAIARSLMRAWAFPVT